MPSAIDSIEIELLGISREIGNIAESNCHFTYGLARRVQEHGKPVSDLTVSELLGLVKEYTTVYNNIHGSVTSHPSQKRS